MTISVSREDATTRGAFAVAVAPDLAQGALV